MYGLSILSGGDSSSMVFLGKLGSSGGNRTDTFCVAMGYTLARTLALPAEEVDDLTTYFRLHHELAVMDSLNVVNEVLPFNTKAAKEAVLAFYRLRERFMNPVMIPLAQRPDSAIVDFFGLSTVLPEGLLDTIKNDPEKLTSYITNLTTLFDGIRKSQVAANAPRADNVQDQFIA